MSSFSALREELSKIRKSSRNDSHQVLKSGKPLLEKYSSRLGDEVWAVYEQVFLACLDFYNSENKQLAEKCLGALEKRFGAKSQRVGWLRGMKKEAEGDFQEANKIYNEILADDPSNAAVQKRKVACLKGQGKTTEAIAELVTLLDTYMTDGEAWKELADLYLSQQMYALAGHCYEELILQNPHNPLHHLKYALLLHTLGGPDNLIKARAYYSKVLELHQDNSRALIGLTLVTQTLAALGKNGTSKTPALNEKLNDFASGRLLHKYQNAPKPALDALTAALDGFSIASVE